MAAADPASRICASTRRASAATSSTGLVQSVLASTLSARPDAAFTDPACGAAHIGPAAACQAVCQSAALVEEAPSHRQPVRGTAARPPAAASRHTVVSLSVTVINHSLETPLPGLDPLVAPFSSKRIVRVPVIRIYGIINDAFSQRAPTSDEYHWRQPHNGRPPPCPHSSNTLSPGQTVSSSNSLFPTDQGRPIIRRPSAHSTISNRDGNNLSSTDMFLDDRNNVSTSGPDGHGSSRNDHSGAKVYSATSSNIAHYATSQSRPSGETHDLPASNVVTNSAPAVHRTRAGASSGNANSAIRQDCAGECLFRSLLGPPAASSAVRKLNPRGWLVEPLDSLKGRSCCAAVHGVLPYFFVPLPLEAHAHPRRWLRWFCCRLREAEQQLQQEPCPTGSSVMRLSSSALQENVGDGSHAAAGRSARQVDSFRGLQQQQQRTYPDEKSRAQKRSGLSADRGDGHVLIYDVRLVWRRSIYGYDHVPRLFAQIFTLMPGFQTKRLAGMLLQGSVTAQRLQPFEVHIPFVIHFLADYKLRGMDVLVVRNPLFVAPVVLSPEQVCTEDDLLLPVARQLSEDETHSVAAASSQRHPVPLASFLEGRDASETTNCDRTVLCKGGAGAAACITPALLTQPPAGVLLFSSWSELWSRLTRAAAEVTEADLMTHFRTLHRDTESDAAAGAAAAGHDISAVRATLLESPSSKSCVHEDGELRTTLGGSGAAADGTITSCTGSTAPLCCPGGCRCQLHRLSECFSRIHSGVEERRKVCALSSPSSAHKEGTASPVNALQTTLWGDKDDAGLFCSGEAYSERSITKQNGAVCICKNGAGFSSSSVSARATSRSNAAAFIMSGAHGPQGREDTSDEEGISASKISRKSTKAQRSTSSCMRMRPCSCGNVWKAGNNRLKEGGGGVHPYFPVSNRRTSCETEFHLLSSQIVNPYLEEAAEGSSGSQYHNWSQSLSGNTAASLPQLPLLATVCDYWQEEAVRAAALGLQLPSQEYPEKRTPPPTLPPAAAAALEQRPRWLAKEAVPQAYKEQLHQLLRRAGVTRRTAVRKDDGEDHFLLSLSQEAPLPSGMCTTRRQQIQQAGQHCQNSVHSRACERSLCVSYAASLAAKESGVHLPRDTSECSHAFHGAVAAMASTPRLSVGECGPSTAFFERRTTRAADATPVAALPACSSPASVPAHEFADCISPATANRSARQPEKCATESDFRASMTTGLCVDSAVVTQRASSEIDTCNGRQHSDVVSKKETSVFLRSNDCTRAEARQLGSATGRSEAAAHAEGIVEAHSVCSQDTARDVDTPLGNNAASIAYDGGTCEKDDVQNTPDIANAFELQQQTTSGSVWAMESAGSARLPAARSCRHRRQTSSEQPGSSGTASTIEWRQHSTASSSSRYSSETGQNENKGGERVLHKRKLLNCRRKRWILTHTQGTETKHAARGDSVQTSTDSGYGASEDSNKSAASVEHIISRADDGKIRLLQQTSRWISCRRCRNRQERSSAAFVVSHGETQQQQHLPQVHCEVDAPRRRARESRRAPKQIIRRENRQRQLHVSTHDDWQQSHPGDPGSQQEPEDPVVGEPYVAQDQPSHGEVQDTASEQRQRGENGAATVKAAHRIQSSAFAAAARGAATVCLEATVAAKATARAPAGALRAGAQTRRPVERKEIATGTEGDSCVLHSHFSSAACTVHTAEQGECEIVDACSESGASFLSHASTVVLSNQDHSHHDRSSRCTGDGMLVTNQTEDATKESNQTSSQRRQQEGQLQTEARTLMLTDSAGGAEDTVAISVQGHSEKLRPLDSKSPRPGSSSAVISAMSALQGQWRRRTLELDLPVSSSEPSSSKSSQAIESGGLSCQQRQKGMQRENTHQETRQERLSVHKGFDAQVVINGWPDVPVQLPFYGDPRDSPLHSLKSAVVAAYVCSSTRQQQTRGHLECDQYEASWDRKNRGPPAASFEQEGPKVHRGVPMQEARHRRINKGQKTGFSHHFSQAAFTLDSRNVPSAIDVYLHNLLDIPSRQTGRHTQQKPQLRHWQHPTCIEVALRSSTGTHSETRRCESGSSVARVHLNPESLAQACDSCALPVQDQTQTATFSRDESSLNAILRHSSALDHPDGVYSSQSNNEEWPPARVLTWRFCRSPPCRNFVFNTCPAGVKRSLKKQARLPRRRQQRITTRMGHAVACEIRRTRMRHSYAVLAPPYAAKRDVDCRNTVGGGKRASRATQVIMYAQQKSQGAKLLVTTFRPLRRYFQNSFSGSHLVSSSPSVQVQKIKALQKILVQTSSAAAKPADHRAISTVASEQGGTRKHLQMLNLALKDVRKCTTTSQAQKETPCVTADFGKRAESHSAPGGAEGGGRAKGSTRYWTKWESFLQERRSASDGGHAPCQPTTRLCQEHCMSPKPADAHRIQGRPKQQTGSQITVARQFFQQAPHGVRVTSVKRGTLIDQAILGFAAADTTGGETARGSAAPVESVAPPKCAYKCSTYRAVTRRSATVFTSRRGASLAASAAGATALEKPSPLAAARGTDAGARVSEQSSSFERTNYIAGENTSHTHATAAVQRPLCEGTSSGSTGSRRGEQLLYSKQDRHLPVGRCKLRSASLAGGETFVTRSRGHASIISSLGTRDTEANADDAARRGECCQLSGVVDTSDTCSLSGKIRRVETPAEATQTQTDAAGAAAVAAAAVSDHQGRRLLYGSMVALEVLTERHGCGEAAPEGLGVPTPWKDAVLAVAFAVRDERLRAACEEIKRRIALGQGKRLQQQKVQDSSEVAQCQSSVFPMSTGNSAQELHDADVPGNRGAFVEPSAANHVEWSSSERLVSGKEHISKSAPGSVLEKSNEGNTPTSGKFTGARTACTVATGVAVSRAHRTSDVETDSITAQILDIRDDDWCCSRLKKEDSEFPVDTGKVLDVELSHGDDGNTSTVCILKEKNSSSQKGYFLVREKTQQASLRGNRRAGVHNASNGNGPVKEREVGQAGRRREKEVSKASIHDLPAYKEALAVIFIDQPYVARTALWTAATCSTAKVAGSVSSGYSHDSKEQGAALPAESSVQAAEISNKACSEAPFPRSFADFAVCWHRRHPPPDAHALLKNYIQRSTQLFAVKNEYELLRKTAVLLTLLDPSVILQWDDNNAGLGYLLRRAAVLGCDREFCLALSRRVDKDLLSRSTSRFARLPGSVGERLLQKRCESRRDIHTGDETSPKQRHQTRGKAHQERVCHLPQEESKFSARILLDCCHVLQQEVKLQQSTLEGVVQQTLGVTLPTIPIAVLLNLWKQGQLAQRRTERRHERMMVAAWKVWERRRIRSKLPLFWQPHDRIESSQQLQQKWQRSRCPREPLYPEVEQKPAHVRQTEPQRPKHLKNESTYRGCLNTLDSCPQLDLDDPTAGISRDVEEGLDPTWGVATMGAVLNHLLGRLLAMLATIDHLEVLPRTAELARLYGCDFHSALVRGSQFKVESVMLRATKRLGYVFASPSQKQVTEQKAPLCIPLVLEPQSGFYWSPVLVLDFQSLYPSIMIANNICFSTSLGSVEVDPTVQPVKAFGVLDLHVPARVFQQISAMYRRCAQQETLGRYAFNEVRQGVFPRVLWDLLRTRVMIKRLMNLYRDCGNERLAQLLNHRQHGLKMITNVSYGYTAASFTGHMPCAELADAIVQTARTTLMRAIQLVENTPRWGGRVLYGDTDSLFVLVEKKSLKAAFEIGREIAYAVTQQNPPPVELQLEKVFLPCCLVSKKRYVGYAYTSPSAKPYFDAKGIESVRRDQCGCTSSLLESTLRTFFTTRDLSCVKRHLHRQWTKILRGDISLKQFIFFRKCRLGSYKAERGAAAAGSLPPQAKVAYERMCSVAEVCNLCSADSSPAVAPTAQIPSFVNLQLGAAPRGERVPFVYAETNAGNLEGFPDRQARCVRLLDFAVSPDKVKGGGRGGMWMHLFCHGTPQLMLRNLSPRIVNRLTKGLLDSHAGKACWYCSGSEGDKVLSGSSDVEEALFIRGYVGGLPSQRALQEKAVFTGYGTDLKVTSGKRSVRDARKTRTAYYKHIFKSVHTYGQPLWPLYSRYYIVKQIIPALDRLFCLLPPPNTVDLSHWYISIPKARRTSSCPHGHLRQCGGTRRMLRAQRLHSTPAAGVSDCDQGRANDCRQGLAGNLRRHRRCVSPRYLSGSAQGAMEVQNGAAEQVGLSVVLPDCCLRGEFHGADMQQHGHGSRGTSSVTGREQDVRRRNHKSICHEALYMCRSRSSPLTTQEIRGRPLCEDGNINTAVAVGLTNELKKAEQQLLEMEALCEACAGSKICGAACSHAWHCEVYFSKLRNENKISGLLSRMHVLWTDRCNLSRTP